MALGYSICISDLGRFFWQELKKPVDNGSKFPFLPLWTNYPAWLQRVIGLCRFRAGGEFFDMTGQKK